MEGFLHFKVGGVLLGTLGILFDYYGIVTYLFGGRHHVLGFWVRIPYSGENIYLLNDAYYCCYVLRFRLEICYWMCDYGGNWGDYGAYYAGYCPCGQFGRVGQGGRDESIMRGVWGRVHIVPYQIACWGVHGGLMGFN